MSRMDSIQRVAAVIEGRRPDRPPVSLWHHFRPEQHRGRAAVQAHLDHLQTFDLDFLKVMNDHGYPDAGTSPTAAELADLPVYRGDEPEFAGQLEVLAELAKHLKDRVWMSTTIFNAWATLRRMYQPRERMPGTPKMDMSADPISARLSGLIQEDRSAVATGLNNVAQSLANFAAKCLEAGADGVFLSVRDDWVDTPENGGPGTYDALVRAGDRRILEAAGRGRFNMLHVCGRPLNLAAFADYPVQVINWADRSAGPSIRDACREVRPAICGGVDNLATLPEGTPAECAAEVADALARADDRPIMIAPGCTYDSDRVPKENLLAVCEAARV
ncbi:MAG: uroporphyrinogen decarboxylase family protein [Planctomycetota bacterium]